MRTPTLVLALSLVLTACSPHMAVPSGFARVDGRHDLRVASPEGVVIAVDVHRNRPRADLQFWAGALRARVASAYGSVEQTSITNQDGVEGVQIRAYTLQGGRPHHYWAAIFVTSRKVVMVEAGGDEAYFTPREAEVEAAIRSVEI